MGMQIILLQLLLCAVLAHGQICQTSAICMVGKTWTPMFKVVPQRSDFFPKLTSSATSAGSSSGSTDPCARPTANCQVSVGGGYRYEFVSELSTWSAANEVCEYRGASLPQAAFRGNSAAFAALKSVMDCRGDYQGYWVPASDRMNEGQWTWRSGQPLTNQDKQNWQGGQPDNSGEQDCAYAGRWSGYKWDDGDCAGFWSVVCESKI